MSNTINADNGVVSGTAGVKLSSDSTGVLDIQTNGTTAITISTAQVVSLTNSPTFTGGTANGVLFLNASKVATSGTALVFDGTSLLVGTDTATALAGYTVVAQFKNSLGIISSNNEYAGAILRESSSSNSISLNADPSNLRASSFLSFGIDGTERARIDSSGNLGIGTTSPAARLNVDAGSAGLMSVFDSTNANGGYLLGRSSGTSVWDLGTAKQALNVGGATDFGINVRSGFMALGTNNTERMRLDSSGNLGIGTTSPAYPLQVRRAGGACSLGLNLDNYGAIAELARSVFYYAIGDSTSDRTGHLFFTRDATATDNLRVAINSAGNVGLGVTPSAWGSTFSGGVFQAKNASVMGYLNAVYLGANYYATNSTDNYIATGFASRYQQTSGQHQWLTAATGTAGNAITFTQAMTLDASGNLGIGTTSPGSKLEIRNDVLASTSLDTTAIKLYNNSDGGSGIEFSNSVGAKSKISFGVTSTGAGTDDSYLGFSTCANAGSLTERARIDSSGNLLVGKSTSSVTTAGCEFGTYGAFFTRSSGDPLLVNRQTNDGTIVSIRQDNTEEGTISVSGTTVSYNGGHLSRYSQTTDNTRIPLVKGTVMSNLDQMAVWEKDGEPLPNEQLNCMKVSDVEGDVNVAGVFVNWDNDDDVYTNDMNVAMTGDMIIRIAQGVTVQRGDLLMSAGDGTAKPQGDDIIRSKTVAKVTSNHVTCTYGDGSYCVPCVLMAC